MFRLNNNQIGKQIIVIRKINMNNNQTGTSKIAIDNKQKIKMKTKIIKLIVICNNLQFQ